MIGRRSLLKSLAAVPLLAPTMLSAQTARRMARAPIRVRDDRLWMPVRFGDDKVHNFILDTGAFTNLISRELAVGLGLRRIGSLRFGGVGGVVRYQAYRAPDVSLGEVRVGSLVFAAYENDLRIHPEAGGALSAGLLTVADTDLDFDAGEWRLHIDGRDSRPGFEALPSSIRSEGPQTGAAKILVDAVIDGETYRLQVDTGAPGEIMLAPAGTRRSGLWNATTPFAPHRRRGIGGDGGAARLVRAGSASLGGISFERPLISLTDPAASRTFDGDGLVGIRLIERMNLSTDIAGRRLWAKRNARPLRPERYGMSGLWLATSGDGLVIEEIGTGSPAAAAGLRRGDRIEGELAEWIRRLGGRPGEAIEIPYRRGGEARSATVTLRESL